MLMSAIATIIAETISYILQIILFKLSLEIGEFMRIISLELLFNTIIIIIIYPLIDKAGTLLEKIFTENKILTKYY